MLCRFRGRQVIKFLHSDRQEVFRWMLDFVEAYEDETLQQMWSAGLIEVLDDTDLTCRNRPEDVNVIIAVMRCLSKIGADEPCVQAGLTRSLERAGTNELVKMKARQVLKGLATLAHPGSGAAAAPPTDTSSPMPQPDIASNA